MNKTQLYLLVFCNLEHLQEFKKGIKDIYKYFIFEDVNQNNLVVDGDIIEQYQDLIDEGVNEYGELELML